MTSSLSPDSTLLLGTGRKLPVLGLGTWKLTRDTSETVARALELGYRMIDTSGDYGTQPGVGEGIRQSGLPREAVFVVSKVEEDEDAFEASKRNLEALGMDRVELMLLHRPPPIGAGEDLWEGLLRAREEGLARDVGVSNYSIEQLQELVGATGEAPVVNQIEWSPFGWSREMLDHCRERGIVIQAYSPLTRTERLEDERLSAIAAEHGKTPAQVVIRWDLQLGVAPLPKAGSRHHLAENLDVFDFELSASQLEELGALNERYSALGSLAY